MQVKYLANISITALTLGLVFYFQNISTVSAFAVAILNLAFHAFLDRQAGVKTEAITKELNELRARVEDLSLNVGLRR